MKTGDIVTERRNGKYEHLRMRIIAVRGETVELESVRTGKKLMNRRRDEVKLV